MDFDDLDQSEVDRRLEDGADLHAVGEAFFHAQACPCFWRITRRCIVSSMALESSPLNVFVDDVMAGQIVRVLQVRHVAQAYQVRARLESPSGWITLLTTFNEETCAEVLEDANPGVYLIEKPARVTSTLTLQPTQGCKDIYDLHEDTLVRVLEIQLMDNERRIRGRIGHPCAGWISLVNTENDYRWAQRQPVGAEAPLLTLDGIEIGATMHLLSNTDALAEACEELGSLTPLECRLTAGAELIALEVDRRYKRVRCDVPLFGEVWFALGCFAWLPDEAEATASTEILEPEEPEEPPPARLRGFSRMAASHKEEAKVETLDIVEAAPPPEPDMPVEPLPSEAEAKVLAGLLRSSQAAAAALEAEISGNRAGHEAASSSSAPVEAAAREVCTLEDFPDGTLVEVLDAMALRAGERSSSKELMRLDKGWHCTVLEHSPEAGSRRMRVREETTQREGWISCATKAGRPLVSLASAQQPAGDLGGRAALPSVDEVLAKVDEDEQLQQDAPGANRVDLEAEPDDPVLQREKAEEAVAVWRGFKDLARLDTPEEIRGLELEVLGEENRKHELVRWGGWDNPSEQQVMLAEDRRLRIMEATLVKREERERKFKDRLQKAMAKSMARSQPMPKSRAIVRRSSALDASGSTGSGGWNSGSSQHVAIEDMRQRLAEERQESALLEVEASAAEVGMSLEEVIAASRRKAVELQAAWAEEDLHKTEYEEPLIEPGTIVRVYGLKGAADLNDLEGMIERWDTKTERWVVRLQNGQCKKIREQNLLPCEALDEEEAAPEEEPEREECFGGAPFAVSMRQGSAIAPPKGDLGAGGAPRPWYAPWMTE